MEPDQIKAVLAGLPLGGVRFYHTIGSTNDAAAEWAATGAPDLSLVVAGAQTAGRGRSGRRWLSAPGKSLSLSLVLRPQDISPQVIPRFTALGALAVVGSLQKHYSLPAQIKWPNDVLVNRRKVCGVLVETSWQGDQLQSVILGIGINIAPDSSMKTTLARSASAFPAASLQDCLGKPVESLDVLRFTLEELLYWLPQLATQTFLQAWENHLAFQGEWVRAVPDLQAASSTAVFQEGILLGLTMDGALRLRTAASDEILVYTGDIHLRPEVSKSKGSCLDGEK